MDKMNECCSQNPSKVAADYRGCAVIHCGLVLVELVVFLNSLATGISLLAIQFYMIERTAVDNGNWTEAQIHDKVSDHNMVMNVCTYMPAVISTFFLGSLADKFGRKLIVLICLFGNLARISMYIVVMRLQLAIELLYIGHVLEGLTGSVGGFLMGIFGILADITEPGTQRNIRFTTTEAAQFISAAVGVTVTGYWIAFHRYEIPTAAAGGSVLASIFFTLIFIPETFRRETDVPMSFRTLKEAVLLFTSREPPGRRSVLLICCLLLFIGAFVLFGTVNTNVLFLSGTKFGWASSKITVYAGVQLLINWLCVIVLTRLLSSRLQESTFLLISAISSCAGLLVQGLANGDAMIYVGAVLNILSAFQTPMSRALLSKLVSASEQGVLFAGIGMSEMLALTVSGVAANGLFKLGLITYYGLHLLVLAGLAAISAVLVGIMKVLIRQLDSQNEKEITLPGKEDSKIITRL